MHKEEREEKVKRKRWRIGVTWMARPSSLF
jgi:hypothetical protein